MTSAKPKRPAPLVDVECAWCGNVFVYPQTVGKGKRKSQCDDCARAKNLLASADWARRNPERRRASMQRHGAKRRRDNPDALRAYEAARRFRRYGVTREWFEQTLIHQGGRCANRACGTSEPGGRTNEWHIDHDHVTGVVRGLLCHRCNLAAGLARDDPNVLRGLARHIDTHRQLHLPV